MSRNNNKKTNFLKSSVAEGKAEKALNFLTENEKKVLGLDQVGNNQKAYVMLKYLDFSYQCFSDWQANELKEFSNFIEKVRGQTWQNIYSSATKNPADKAGLCYTPLSYDKYPNTAIFNSISKDTTFFELRVSGKIRVHGFRAKAAFCLIFLDREHDICP